MKPGDPAPDFELSDQDGKTRHLKAMLEDGPVVLFFYPAAMTSGCTTESCHFRDLKAEFEKLGAQRVGISVDTVEKQKQFSDKHSFDYPLVSDVNGEVATAYGVKRKILAMLTPVKRSTFVIGKDGIIKDVISSELKFDLHADKALESLSH
ncbi:peroxiredoxin [Fodinicola feengrottensis]|uniref:peroxiredoxin n=1 Tax=Fodinicola feengrottensis TaxID=435914 RepID=UPI0013D73FA9|nr:peroxiredoxin [Fodinicola feengrottensis]